MAKKKDGKAIRRKDFINAKARVVNFYILAFAELMKHNGVSDSEVKKHIEIMHQASGYRVLKDKASRYYPMLSRNLDEKFFIEKDDKILAEDIGVFLRFIIAKYGIL